MAADRRKKGCPNEECERHQNKVKLKATEEFCPKCGTPLIFVCAKCFREIEDIDPKHRICKLCEAKQEEKRAEIVKKVKRGGEKAAVKAGEIAGNIAGGVGGKVVKNVQGQVIDKGAKAINGVVDKVLKK